MIVFWVIILVLPSLAFCGGLLFAKDKLLKSAEAFFASRKIAIGLTIFGWIWTAYECHTIGIDVFDMLLKAFPGELVILTVVLSYLTIIWMPKNLSTRALMGILMLIPAEAFKTTRAYLPAEGFAPVQLLVGLIYLYAIIGMYGMFYPWRIEKAIRFLCKTR